MSAWAQEILSLWLLGSKGFKAGMREVSVICFLWFFFLVCVCVCVCMCIVHKRGFEACQMP